LPDAPLTDPGEQYSRTGLFTLTRSRMRLQVCLRPLNIQ
jgi:hypothetical protein